MGIIDSQLEAIDWEIEDMNFAEGQAQGKGLNLGQYDLQTATAARKKDREKQMAMEQMGLEAEAAGIEENRQLEMNQGAEQEMAMGAEQGLDPNMGGAPEMMGQAPEEGQMDVTA